ncbi:ABC-2 type transport system ATP-binding protein [Ruminococcus sp. YE71]|uniref:ABC transporter ATP-binding protein n=1 Tax=unclassified Ruminococcus TaxID=2608920 RepID=UPI0008926A78|nr:MULTISPECIES: ABC transporter ATP-binding protein [unclassified Ruminococcus]SDA22643.1 ABC-2 type transport system ATP-binding protein [Ruminococcus sp. YE78]SFW38522.1 ABC-2 type transport system ATP-binding protein [Ruminococcus sp. YE71]
MIEIENASMLFQNKGLMAKGEPFRAVDKVSITIPDGCVYGFLGSNGAGKSTLMRMMCGVYKMNEGSIKLDGREVYDDPQAKSNIFFVNDETVQYTPFTLNGLARYYKSYYPTFSDEVFGRLSAKLNLPLDKRLSEFSKGMKRQAVVIIGLSCMTKYLMLDEAFDGLDPAMRKVVKNMIVDEMLDRDATLIVSSHNIAEINELCDRAMLIHKGQLIFSGELDEISGGFRKVQLARKNLPVTREELEASGVTVMQCSVSGSVTQAVIKGTEEEIMRKLKGIKTDLTEIIPLTLEEIFIYELEARGYGSECVPNDK